MMTGPKITQAEILVGLAQDVKLLYDPALDAAFASLTVGEHTETWHLRSKAFKRWLVNKFVLSEAKPPGAQAVQDAIGALEAAAQFQGYPRAETAVRLAGDDTAIYLDLGNDAWEVVRVTAAGWTILPESPIRFRRPRGMHALPRPVPGGDLSRLRTYLNAPDEKTWYRLLAWLINAYRARGPYAPLAVFGEQGSAKTTTAEVLKRLIDPGKAMVRAEPRDVRDLMIAASNGWLLAFDNVSRLPPWLSDAFCRMATGGGFSTRELYSDGDEVLFEAKRPIILNAIDEVMSRPDLLDRAEVVTLPRIPEDRRRPESAFWPAFEAAAPEILGVLLEAVSTALRRLPTMPIPARLPRMADYVLFTMAGAPALGIDPQAFLTIYLEGRETAHETSIELSPIGPAIRALAETGWCGTASELLERLSRDVPESTRRAKDWPATSRTLAGALRRLQPPLRAVGVEVAFLDDRALGARRRQIVVQQEEVNDRSHRSERSGAAFQGGLPFPGNDAIVPGDHDPVPRERWSPAGNDAGTIETPAGNARNDGNDAFPSFHSEGCDCRRCLP